jgi:hypothetical protein
MQELPEESPEQPEDDHAYYVAVERYESGRRRRGAGELEQLVSCYPFYVRAEKLLGDMKKDGAPRSTKGRSVMSLVYEKIIERGYRGRHLSEYEKQRRLKSCSTMYCNGKRLHAYMVHGLPVWMLFPLQGLRRHA